MIATTFGNLLRADVRQRPLTDAETQTWSSLQLLEGLPDGGWNEIESSELSKMHAFAVAAELSRSYLPHWRVAPTVCAWIAFHSQGRLKYVTMWAAIVAHVALQKMRDNPDPMSSDPERWGEVARRRVLRVQDLAKYMNHMIPTDAQFELVWEGTKLANGKYELDLPRSWQ